MSSIASTVGAMNVFNSSGNANPFQAQPYADMSQWWGNSAQAPTQTALNIPNWNDWKFQVYGQEAPTYQTYGAANPVYQGLMEGDYNRLEESLRTPGEIAAREAYRTGSNTLADNLGGKGVYGSSLYTTEQTDNLGKTFQNTMAANAANAASNRYGMQQKDLMFGTQTDLDVFGKRMAENNSAQQQGWNSWKSRLDENSLGQQLGAQESWRKNQYGFDSALTNAKWTDTQNQRAIDFSNSLAQDWWNEQKRKMQWDSNQTQQAFGNAMTLAGNTDHLSDAQRSQQISKMSQQDSGAGGLLGGLGSVLGTAASFIPGLGSMFGAGTSTAGNIGGQSINSGLSGTTTGRISFGDTPYL